MLRTVLLVAAAAGVVVLVGCEPAGEEARDAVGADPAGQAAAPAPNTQVTAHDHLPLDCERGNRRLDAKVVRVDERGEKKIKIPTSEHELDIAAGVVPPDGEALFVMHEVEGENNDCRVAIQHLAGALNQSMPADPYILRIACWHLPGNAPCSADDAIRIDDDTLIENGSVITTGGTTRVEFKLQSLSTYALAAPGGPGGE